MSLHESLDLHRTRFFDHGGQLHLHSVSRSLENVAEHLNIVYPPGTPFSEWRQGLETACQRIAEFQPDALVVPLGVDTFEGDPISFFKLKSEDYLQVGERLSQLGLPTVVTMEGGYDVDAIGVNVANVLSRM